MSRGFTIPELFRAMGLEMDKHATWAAGNVARNLYRERMGHLPPKALRAKTGGGGSHCFALYPDEWRPEIERVVRQIGAQAAKQGKLL